MLFISAIKTKEMHFLLYLSIGLLNLPLYTDSTDYKIKLVGPTRCSGRVEVFHRQSWGSVCDDHWSTYNADVVCREVKCGTAIEAKAGAYFGQGKGHIWLDDVQCTGNESSLVECRRRDFGENNCGHAEDASVICSEHVRLVNGTNRCSGRVEVYHDGHWSKVCNSALGKTETDVLCVEVGCGVPDIQPGSPPSDEGSEMIGVKTRCFGNESSLTLCNIQEFNGSCVDAPVVCGNTIRVVNGTNRCSGRVEVYHEKEWGTVCDDRWGMQEADVVCREIDCGTPLAVMFKAHFGQGTGRVWMDDVQCKGHEKALTECPHSGFGENNCDHHEDAGLICSDKLRLVNGTDRCSGTVEVHHDGQWVKICRDGWSTREAALVCEELDCGKLHNNSVNPHFGESKSAIKLQVNSTRCESAAVSCSGYPQMRLVNNGTDRCSGRVEVNHFGEWGTVCDDMWDIRDAEVVCRELDCGTVQAARMHGYFGHGDGEIWLDDVECLGNETSIVHCQHPPFGDNNCNHIEDAGVVCSNSIRLINGSNYCSGRVEFYHGDRWLPVYDVNWDRREAEVVCREMNCGEPVTASGSFGQSSGLSGWAIGCGGGKERSLTQCSAREVAKNSRVGDATVVCSGNVKLVNGSSRCSGRVEFYHDGQWGTVCGESWDGPDAAVVCRELNCGTAHSSGSYGSGTGKMWNDEMRCEGHEFSLSECDQKAVSTCNATAVASVLCSDDLPIRLVNGTDKCSGRVEAKHGDEWGTVCGRDWTMADAAVVCKLWECGHAVNVTGNAHFGQGSGPVWEASKSCFGNETSLQQCSVRGFNRARCGHEEDAGVFCGERLRLAGGRGECAGRVEILHMGYWGTVCDDEWGIQNAEVVCRQLGCGHAVAAPKSAPFGEGNGPIWLDDVVCNGQESALTQCSNNGFGQHNCGHSEDASVICLGSLSKPIITLSPGPVHWGDRVEIRCSILTEHWGGTFVLQNKAGTFRMEKHSANEAATFTINKVDLSHKGSYYCQYEKRLANQNISFPQGDLAELSVTVTLEQPSISLVLTSHQVMFVSGPDRMEVTKGSSFSIKCSIHSRYPAGFFYLTMSNLSITEPKQAFADSAFYWASFEFPAMDDKHQGEYRCIYVLNVSTSSFSSAPSKSLQVMVLGEIQNSASEPYFISGALCGMLLLVLLLLISYLVWKRRGQSARAFVQFTKRVEEVIMKAETEDKGDGALDGRDYNTRCNNEYGNVCSTEDKVYFGNSVGRNTTEDSTGEMCYELEQLIQP